MTSASANQPGHLAPSATIGKSAWSFGLVAAWGALLLLLAAAAPLFVCMPLWIDCSLYDLAARNVLGGGVAYRDVWDTNLPGMVWLHVLVRSVLGWSSEALRLADLGFFGVTVFLLTWWLRQLGQPPVVRAWLAVVCYLSYFATNEWCHCQRDLWLMPFALAALHLRRRQLDGLLAGEAPRRLLRHGFAEGLLWAAAFWVKPFVAVPAAVCWLTAALLGRRAGAGRLAADAAGILGGGLLAGALGVAWLVGSGAWPYFWDVMTGWNREYLAVAEPLARRVGNLFTRLPSWGLVHVAALPIALLVLASGFRHRNPRAAPPAQALLAACYLGWVVQAVGMQKAFDYNLAPLVPLALTLLAGSAWPAARPLARRAALAGFLLLTLLMHPLRQGERLALWGRCGREGSSPELRDALKLLPRERYSIDWVQLDRVREFLEAEGVRDGELTCYHSTTHPLYLQLGLRPSTPFLHFDILLLGFPGHRETIRQALEQSGQRYVVSDLESMTLGLAPEQVRDESAALPAGFPPAWRDVFPWTEPVVFRAGRYLVHRVDGRPARLVPASR